MLSFIFGYIAIEAQKTANALDTLPYYTFFDRILFIGYALMMYLWKLVAPINLSCFYNYPLKQDGIYPLIFYIAPVVILVLAFLIYKSMRFGKDVLFGFGFFFITIILVLQILPVGIAIIADRYTYLPYIGLFFILARWFNNLLENKSEKYKSLKTPSVTALVLFIGLCCYLTFQRTKVWHDSITLWSDAIEKFNGASVPFKNRGIAYYRTKQYDKAIADLNSAIQLQYDDPEVYYNRGRIYSALGKYEEAINNYTSAILHRSKFTEAYYNRGLTYWKLGKYEEAINDYTSAILHNPKFANAYSNRGLAYYDLGKYEEAINDYTSAILHNPKFAVVYNNRANAYFTIQKFQPALEDALKAKQLGYNVDPRFIEILQTNIKNSTH